jgi:NADH-quinone oxidoreductase subunit L
VSHPEARSALDERFAPLTNFLRNRWFIDAVFEQHIVEGLVLRTAAGAASADALLIDRAVNGVAWSSRQAGEGLAWSDRSLIDGIVRFISAAVRFLSWPSRALQSGFLQSYALLFLAGVLAALGFCLSR